jgi:four helix bundle protein
MSYKVGGFKDLLVWQKAMDLVVVVYDLTRVYPKEELYGLISQTRRAVVSIPANIAEGQRRSTHKDFCNFLRVAHGSGAELSTHIEIAHRLNYITSEQALLTEQQLDEVMRMTSGMIRALGRAR